MMDYRRIAARLARFEPISEAAVDPILAESIEHSCHMEISLSVDFHGEVDEDNLIRKLKSEVIASLKIGMEQVGKDLGIQGARIVVQPLRVECDEKSDIDDPEF